MCIAYF
jgi:hypothetical protein